MMPKTFEDVLMEEFDARLLIQDRWLVWDKLSKEWVVYGKHYRHSSVLAHAASSITAKYRGLNKKEALRILVRRRNDIERKG